MGLILEIIILVFTVFLTDFFTYKLIRKIDRNERKKLAKKESEYMLQMKEELKAILKEENNVN